MRKYSGIVGLIVLAGLIGVGCVCEQCAPAVLCAGGQNPPSTSYSCDYFHGCNCPSTISYSYGFYRPCADKDGNTDCSDCNAPTNPVQCLQCFTGHYDLNFENCQGGSLDCHGQCAYS